MKMTRTLMLLLSLVFLPNPSAFAQAGAEQQEPVSAMTPMPERFLLKSEVESQYGTPLMKSEPVGEPVISYWEYNDYLVYFEYDQVLHAFRKRD